MLRGEAARLLPPPHPRASGSRRGPGPQRTLPRVRWVSQPRPPRGRLCVRRHPARDTSGCTPATGVGPSPPPPAALPPAHRRAWFSRQPGHSPATRRGSRSPGGGKVTVTLRAGGGEGPAAGPAQRPLPYPPPRGGARARGRVRTLPGRRRPRGDCHPPPRGAWSALTKAGLAPRRPPLPRDDPAP